MGSASRTVLAFAFLIASVAVTQAANSVRVDVPFDFVVQGHALQAGSYTIRQTDPYNPTALQFQGNNGKVVFVFAKAIDPQLVGDKLVFGSDDEVRVLKSLVTHNGTLSFTSTQKLTKQAHRSSETSAGN